MQNRNDQSRRPWEIELVIFFIPFTLLYSWWHAQTKYLRTKEKENKGRNQKVIPLDVALQWRTLTSIPEISARGSLLLWAVSGTSYRSGWKGEKCWPPDHVRHTSFIHQLCSHPTFWSISTYIQNCSHFFFLGYLHCVLVHLLFTYALFHNNFFRGSAPLWNNCVIFVVRITLKHCH